MVCADGGAARAYRAGWVPHVLVGDWDSLDPALLDWLGSTGTERIRHPVDKDKTDTELAVDIVAGRGFSRAFLLAGLGGRLDHTLANLFLTRYAADLGVDLRLVSPGTIVQLVRGSTILDARSGDRISLISLRDQSTGISTRGLRFPLVNGVLTLGSSLGVSNEATVANPCVEVLDGEVLAIRIRGARTL